MTCTRSRSSGDRAGHALPNSPVARGRAGFPLLLLLLFWAAPSAAAENLIADLTQHLIPITTGFTGAAVVLFGATDGPGDVVVVVRGSNREVTVRRKSRIAGIWINTDELTFAEVPSFYAVAASRPIEDVLPPETAALHAIGLANLTFEPATPEPAQRVGAFAAALIRQEQRAQLFANVTQQVHFLGERLFRTTIRFPANVPTGTYLVQVFLVRDGTVVGGQNTPLVISKEGVDAAVFEFADRQPGFYGAVAVFAAVMAGWLASLPFRGA
jgi:uncharacterized protein (TIGR02186 family)